MKIALCHPSVLPVRGGCETYIAGLARRLVADGHEVHLYAGEWDAGALPARLHYHPVALPALPRFLRPWYFSRACGRLLALAGQDVSVGFDKIAGVDVYYPQGGAYEASAARSIGKHRSGLLRALLRSVKWLEPAHLSYLLLERAQYRRPGAVVVAISDMVRRHLEDSGVPPARVARVPIAAPRERLAEDDRPGRRARSRRLWGLAEGRVAALFVSMNHRLKGLEPLLYALARLRREPIDLVVAGPPPARGLARLARRLGVAERVRAPGYCADMRDAYFACDLLAHPTFYDPCSNAVLEALACGLPVITSRHNGASELLRPTSPPGVCREGYVIADPHDHAELADCLAGLLDPARRRACAEAAREAAAGWTFEDHYQALMRVLASAPGARGSTPPAPPLPLVGEGVGG
jgi:UDP-glucose:(heptosyl)LPS alpha-1,3-glucosyltransferase